MFNKLKLLINKWKLRNQNIRTSYKDNTTTPEKSFIVENVIYGQYSPVDWMVNRPAIVQAVEDNCKNAIIKTILYAIKDSDQIFINFMRRTYFRSSNTFEKILELIKIIDNSIDTVNRKSKGQFHKMSKYIGNDPSSYGKLDKRYLDGKEQPTVDASGYLYNIPIYSHMLGLDDSTNESMINKLYSAIVHNNPSSYDPFMYRDIMDDYNDYLKSIDNRDSIVLLGFSSINPMLYFEELDNIVITIGMSLETHSSIYIDAIYTYHFQSNPIVAVDITYNELMRLRSFFIEKYNNSTCIDNIIKYTCSYMNLNN